MCQPSVRCVTLPRMTRVFLEIGKSRVFASAADWPGWCRSGKGEEAALDALATYADRYREVVEAAGVSFAGAEGDLEVIERLPGDMTTDFGAPGAVAAADLDNLKPLQSKRLALLVTASWTVLDRVVAVTPGELRKGPRGGGRDRDKMVDHVLGAEVAYARKLGVRHKQPAIDDQAAIAGLRADITSALTAANSGQPEQDQGWPARYAARRIAWHVLDHAWEMQDRTNP